MQVYTKIKKTSMVWLLTLALVFGSVLPAYGQTAHYTEAADALYALGLFLGTDQGYELLAESNRAQGAVMFVRLLGAEQVALDNQYPHPFTDVPTWAAPHVGYLYENGLTLGVSETHFGATQSITAMHYMTFILRALGYVSFDYRASVQLAYEAGLVDQSFLDAYYLGSKDFIRDDLVYFSYLALFMSFKDSEVLLYDDLLAKGVFEVDTNTIDYPYTHATINLYPQTLEALQQSIEVMAFERIPETTFYFTTDSNIDYKAVVSDAITNLSKQPGYFSTVAYYSFTLYSNRLELKLGYLSNQDQLDRAKAVADQIISETITANMTPFERQLALHDYLVRHVDYERTPEANWPDSVYTMYGALVLQSAVCQGYAEAYQYLLALAGIESLIVVGDGISNQGVEAHAWNLVQLDDEWYHVDPTWNDIGLSLEDKRISYVYMNVTDEAIGYDHVFKAEDYPKADGVKYQYFRYFNLYAENETQLKQVLIRELDQKMPNIRVQAGFDLSSARLSQILNDVSHERFSTLSYSYAPGPRVIELSNISY